MRTLLLFGLFAACRPSAPTAEQLAEIDRIFAAAHDDDDDDRALSLALRNVAAPREFPNRGACTVRFTTGHDGRLTERIAAWTMPDAKSTGTTILQAGNVTIIEGTISPTLSIHAAARDERREDENTLRRRDGEELAKLPGDELIARARALAGLPLHELVIVVDRAREAAPIDKKGSPAAWRSGAPSCGASRRDASSAAATSSPPTRRRSRSGAIAASRATTVRSWSPTSIST
jgi:hypothetical protein